MVFSLLSFQASVLMTEAFFYFKYLLSFHFSYITKLNKKLLLYYLNTKIMNIDELKTKLDAILTSIQSDGQIQIMRNPFRKSHNDCITVESALKNDLGFDSLDIYELAMKIEKKFGLPTIPDNEIAKWITVNDVLDYLRIQLNVR